MINIKNQIIIAKTKLKAAKQEGNETEQKVWSSILASLIKLQTIERMIE